MTCKGIECCQIVSSDAWVILVEDMVSKLSLSRASISCSCVLGLSHVTGVFGSVGAWPRWKCVIFIETLDFVRELWGAVLLCDFLSLHCKSLVELLLAIFTRGWSLIAFKSVNHLRSLLGLESCRAGDC